MFNGMVAAYDAKLEPGRGQVINISSIYGHFPFVGAAVYRSPKAAVDFILRFAAHGTPQSHQGDHLRFIGEITVRASGDRQVL